MDFAWNQQQDALRKRLAEFSGQHCTEAQAQALDREPVFPADLHRALAQAGLLGQAFPESLGGSGGNITDIAIIHECLGGRSDSALNLLFVNGICGTLILYGGSDAQKQQWIPAIAGGELGFAFALTEPGAGSDASAICATARAEGDEYVVDGVKIYTTGARDADYIMAAVRTDPEQKASRGTSLLAVPTRADGLRIEAMEKLAGNAIASCRVQFDGVRVPAANRVGGENQAWPLLMLGGGLERLIVSAAAVGAAQCILDEVCAFAKSRKVFGQPVADFQAIQHQLADMATEIDAARLLVYRAAWLMDQGKQPVKEVSMAKLYASERLAQIALRGMRLLGGQAYFKDSPMQRRLRESMLSLYAGGTVEIQRNLIARSLAS